MPKYVFFQVVPAAWDSIFLNNECNIKSELIKNNLFRMKKIYSALVHDGKW